MTTEEMQKQIESMMPTPKQIVEHIDKKLEEKAKAYDEALNRAKHALDCHNQGMVSTDVSLIISMFPELGESEDERIRKELIDAIQGLWDNDALPMPLSVKRKDKWLAWLKKQGKCKDIFSIPTRETILSIWELGNDWKDITHGSISTKYGTQLEYIQKHWQESEYYLEKQSEQKPVVDFKAKDWYVSKVDGQIHDITYNPANKVEPKFKVGDLIIDINDIGNITIEKIIGFYGNKVRTIDTGGFYSQYPQSELKHYHLWTIKDAKNGDVLISQYGKPFIYNGNYDSLNIGAYCGITCDDNFKVAEEKCHWTENVNIEPSTKEQSDLLFTKMNEAGYEWDAEKKELKIVDWSKHIKYEPDSPSIIEQKPTWSEEDDYNLQCVIAKVTSDIQKGNVGRNNELIDWLKSLKDKIKA